jgi:hypothetical protein
VFQQFYTNIDAALKDKNHYDDESKKKEVPELNLDSD